MAKELVLPYVRRKLADQAAADISVAGFMKFARYHAKYPAYALMCDVILDAPDGIFFTYRAGLRSGTYELVEAGFAHVAPFWSARSHPKYRQIDAYHCLTMASAPPELKDLLHQSTSFQLSSVPYSGEGTDFKLEEANRGVQHWIPAVPHDEDWCGACANYDHLSNLQRSILTGLNLKDPKLRTGKPPTNIPAAYVVCLC